MGKHAAIILAGGKGSRMQSAIKKQYLPLLGKPLLYYALKVFEDAPLIDSIVLVTDEAELCRETLIRPYGFRKVKFIVPGGKERRDSVLKGLRALREEQIDMVLIHDGARPLVSAKIIEDSLFKAAETGGAVAAVPVKDTIKVADGTECVKETLDRAVLRAVQTPQTFDYEIIARAYEIMHQKGDETTTDDAGVAEKYGGIKVAFSRGSYRNLKVTTPEDMVIAEAFLKKMEKNEKK